MRRPRMPRVTALVGIVLWSITGNPGQADDKPRAPSILMIMPDQWRAQGLGCMGNPDVRTPHFDRLASQGMLFRNTFANTPVCCPARAIILTGQYASRNGMIANDLRLRESAVTLPEVLAGARVPHRLHRQVAPRRRPSRARVRPPRPEAPGLRLLGGPRMPTRPLPPGLLPRRADPDPRRPLRAGGLDRRGHRVPPGRRGRPVLPRSRDGPAAQSVWRARSLHEDVRPRLAHHAAELGAGITRDGSRGTCRLLRRDHRHRRPGRPAAGRSRRTRPGGRHHRPGHLRPRRHARLAGARLKRKPWEESIRVPGIVRWPGRIAAGHATDALLSHVDLAPTLLALAGVEVPDTMQGSDLSPVALGATDTGPDSVFFQIFVPYHAGRHQPPLARRPHRPRHVRPHRGRPLGPLRPGA